MTEPSQIDGVELPDRARIVVVGGGVVGCSIAYHLTQLGIGDVLLLERHQLTGGTTWHAAGLVGQLRATENLTRLARYTLELYQRLEAETGQATGFRSPGAISMASTDARWEELRRTAAMARYLDVEAVEIGPTEIAERFPLCDVNDIVGGIWLPNDGVVGPSDVTMALAKGARQGGATITEGVGVADLIVADGATGGTGRSQRCTGVVTDDGRRIEADVVVLACGLWTRELAANHGVRVPLMAAEHHYVVTEAVPGCDPGWPVLRDPDRWAYLKPEAGGSMLVGLFEPVARPWPRSGPPPIDRSFVSLDADPDHLAAWIPAAFDRIPALHDVGIRLLFDGPESFTPDDAYILGEAPTLSALFVAAGFNSIGIQSAGGVGMAMAHWITEGEPPLDLSDVDIRRFEPFQATEQYLRARTVEGLGLLYANHWPHRQYETARDVRRSPLHDRLDAAGASFGSLTGWERAMFFARPELGIEAVDEYSWGRQYWHDANAMEHAAVRERVGLFDQTSFSKFVVQGADAAAVLDRLSAGAVAGEVGRTVYTQWLNERGGIEADLTVSRLSETEFWVIGGAGTRTRDLHRLRAAIDAHPGGANATVTDITSAYAVLAIMGPAARDFLGRVSDADLTDAAFPFATHAEIDLGSAVVRANRMSYVGELGWELFVPSEFAVHVFDQLRAAGSPDELTLCGYHTMNSLRFEKGFRHWGHDIGPDDSPLEAGLSFAVAWDKPVDFIGRAALERQRSEGINRRLVQIAITPDGGTGPGNNTEGGLVLLHHNEPIHRDGRRVGYVTGGMWGHTLGAAVGMGWVESDIRFRPEWVSEGHWEVEIGTEVVSARVQTRPLLPSNPVPGPAKSRP